MVRKAVSGLGRTLVTSGVILLLFVAYQLWGTGINTARAQSSLDRQLSDGFDQVPKELLQGIPVSTQLPDTTINTALPPGSVPQSTAPETSTPPTTEMAVGPETTATTSTVSPTIVPSTASAPATTRFGRELVTRKTSKQLPLRAGEAVGQLVIPRISLDKAIVQGTSVEALKKGPGHYKTTPFPGEEGNSAIACHRTTYGGPCFRLDELRPGDPIFVARKDAKGGAQWFRYNVYDKTVVKPSANEVLLPQGDKNTLTLTTCHPQYSAKQRLVVHAELVGPAVEAELIDAAKDPLSEEYQRQLDARTKPATVPPNLTADPPSRTAVPKTQTTFDDPIIGEDTLPVTTALSSNATTTIAKDSTGALDGPAGPLTTGGSESDTPRFDGERSTGKTYKVAFFSGTAPAWLHTLGWGAVCGSIWMAVWLAVRRRRSAVQRWAAYTAGFVLLFLPALYFCFENVSRLLPETV